MKKIFITMALLFLIVGMNTATSKTDSPPTLDEWVKNMDTWEQSSDVLETWVVSRDTWEQKKDTTAVQKHEKYKKHKKDKRHHNK